MSSEAPTEELPAIDARHAPFFAARDWVALIVAVGLVSAVNLITIAVMIDAIHQPETGGLSENATQVLTGAFGGMIGILGSQMGYKAGLAHGRQQQEEQP